MPHKHRLEVYDWTRNPISNESLARTAAKLPDFFSVWCPTQILTLLATSSEVPDTLSSEHQKLAAEFFVAFYVDKEES